MRRLDVGFKAWKRKGLGAGPAVYPFVIPAKEKEVGPSCSEIAPASRYCPLEGWAAGGCSGCPGLGFGLPPALPKI